MTALLFTLPCRLLRLMDVFPSRISRLSSRNIMRQCRHNSATNSCGSRVGFPVVSALAGGLVASYRTHLGGGVDVMLLLRRCGDEVRRSIAHELLFEKASANVVSVKRNLVSSRKLHALTVVKPFVPVSRTVLSCRGCSYRPYCGPRIQPHGEPA